MAVALGGRVAEEIVYGEEEVTTGASNDLQQVANVARQMITKFGMSDKIGPVSSRSVSRWNVSRKRYEFYKRPSLKTQPQQLM